MSGPILNSDPFRIERVEVVPPPTANGNVRLRPGNELQAVPSDSRDDQPVLHGRDRSSHIHRPGSTRKERGKIANLRGLVRDRLGHHRLTDRSGLELISNYVDEKPLSAAELFSATYIDVEPRGERPETPIDTSQYGILPFNAKGQHHGLWQVQKEFAPKDIQNLMLNHVAWFPDDPVLPLVRESVELVRNGRWQRSLLALNTPGYFSFGLGTTAYHVDEDRLADNGQARYVNIGTPRNPSFIRLCDLRPFVDEDYEGMAGVERFPVLPERSGEADVEWLRWDLPQPQKRPTIQVTEHISDVFRYEEGWPLLGEDPKDVDVSKASIGHPNRLKGKRMRRRKVPGGYTGFLVRKLEDRADQDESEAAAAPISPYLRESRTARTLVTEDLDPSALMRSAYQSKDCVFIYTPPELAVLCGFRPSVEYAATHPEQQASAHRRWHQAAADLGKLLMTADTPAIQCFATEATVASKYRDAKRVFTLTGEREHLKRLDALMLDSAGKSPVEMLRAIKSEALDFLMGTRYFEPRGWLQPLDTTENYAWINDTLNDLLGVDAEGRPLYVNSVLHGSAARLEKDLDTREPNDIDLIVEVNDYHLAMERLAGTRPSYQDKRLNIELVGPGGMTRFLGMKSDSLVLIDEGLALNGELSLPVPGKKDIKEGTWYNAASRHCLVKGVTASLPELEQAGMLDTPGFVSAMTKIPLINFQLARMSSTGSVVPHKIVGREYAHFLDRLHVDDPRSMDTSTARKAAKAIVTSAYVSSCLFALGPQQA